MKEITIENFDTEILNTSLPSFVEFWASWCPPCKMMEPLISKLEDEYQDRFKFYSVNIDRNAELADRFNVCGVPTFICFNNGIENCSRLVGAQTKRKLLQLMNVK